jgi:virulence-associated protein VapD
MYAVAFDLTVAETLAQHPKGIRQAYDDIGDVLGQHGFRRRCATSGPSASNSGRTSPNW